MLLTKLLYDPHMELSRSVMYFCIVVFTKTSEMPPPPPPQKKQSGWLQWKVIFYSCTSEANGMMLHNSKTYQPGFLNFHSTDCNLSLDSEDDFRTGCWNVNNSPSQDSSHSDDHFQSRYVTPGLKPFSYDKLCYNMQNWQLQIFKKLCSWKQILYKNLLNFRWKGLDMYRDGIHSFTCEKKRMNRFIQGFINFMSKITVHGIRS